MKHLLSIQSLSGAEISRIVALAVELKAARGKPGQPQPLANQCWGLIFSKSSTRTRVSFEVGIRELGGEVMFLSANDIQLGRGEPIRDTARVMGRMLGGAVIRTYAQSEVDEFAEFSGIPTINALTDDEHPCQILADIQTIEERLGPITGKKIAFIGDCACNVARSWVYAAEALRFNLALAGPQGYQSHLTNAFTTQTADVREAAKDADVLYTDVWVSMGMEAEKAERSRIFQGYQINHELVALAKKHAIVQHCLPAYRDQEISEAILEERAEEIFDQAENRLHAQKGILHWLTEKPQS